MNRKIVALLVVLALCLPMVMGLAEVAKEGYPIVDTPITMTVAVAQTEVQTDFNDIIILKDFEEVSGMDMQYTNIPSSDRQTQLSLMLASGEVPEILLKMQVTPTDIAKYADEGLFIALSDYEEYMPNLYRWFEMFPSAKDAVTMQDGKIYGAPYILAGDAIRMGQKVFFNTDVMAKLGHDKIPTTIEGLLEYLAHPASLTTTRMARMMKLP